MISFVIILVGLAASWHYTDLSADAQLNAIVAPLGLAFFTIALLVRIVLVFHRFGLTRRGYSNSNDFGDWD